MINPFEAVANGKLEIIRNNDYSLVLQRSKLGAFFGALISILVIIFCFVIYLNSEQEDKAFIFVFFLLLVTVSVSSIYLSFYAIVKGEVYKFYKKRNKLYKNNKKWFNFKEITGIVINHIYDSEHDSYDYDLSLTSIGNHEYKIDETKDLEYLKFLADEIALVLDVNVRHQID